MRKVNLKEMERVFDYARTCTKIIHNAFLGENTSTESVDVAYARHWLMQIFKKAAQIMEIEPNVFAVVVPQYGGYQKLLITCVAIPE